MDMYNRLYKDYFERLRKKYTRIKIGDKTIGKRVKKVMDRMSERDRHILFLYGLFGRVSHIAKEDCITIKQADSRVNTAVKHLMCPNNVVEITGVKLFGHTGKSLSQYELTTKTIKALKKSNIETDDDLIVWYNLGPEFLFRIPGIGQLGVVECLRVLNRSPKSMLHK